MTYCTFTLVHVTFFLHFTGVTSCRAFSKPRLFKIFDNYVNNSYNLNLPAYETSPLAGEWSSVERARERARERERERAGKKLADLV